MDKLNHPNAAARENFQQNLVFLKEKERDFPANTQIENFFFIIFTQNSLRKNKSANFQPKKLQENVLTNNKRIIKL